jgi:hypothetical protein
MEDRDYCKEKAIETITKTIDEMEEVLNALRELKTAVLTENLPAINVANNTISDHISTGYGEHLRFDVPTTWGFTNELELEAEAKPKAIFNNLCVYCQKRFQSTESSIYCGCNLESEDFFKGLEKAA